MKKVSSIFMVLALVLVFGVCQASAIDSSYKTTYNAITLSDTPSDDGDENPAPEPDKIVITD